MYTIERGEKLTLWERVYIPEVLRGLSITARHFIKNLIHIDRRMTVEYPEQKQKIPTGYRAEHRLMLRPDGEVRCTACMCCATVCPSDCIEIVAEEVPEEINQYDQAHSAGEGGRPSDSANSASLRRAPAKLGLDTALPGGGALLARPIEKRPAVFNINMLRCVFCGLCVEACPCDAIRMDTGKYENSQYTREDFIYDKAKLTSNHPEGVSPYSVAIY